jgi:chromate transporter
LNPLSLFALVLRSALLSTGGFGNVPMLHDDLVSRGIATDRTFAESLAVGQISPGPNGLWVVCLGYFLGGWLSAFAALLAIAIPPLLVVGVERIYERHRRRPAVEGFMAGLEIAVIAVFVVVMVRFLTGSPANGLTLGVAGGAFVLAISGRAPLVAVLGLAALAGTLYR